MVYSNYYRTNYSCYVWSQNLHNFIMWVFIRLIQDTQYMGKYSVPYKSCGICRSKPPASCNEQPSLQWRHNGLVGVSNDQPHHYLLGRLFGRRSKKTSKLRVTGLCACNSPVTGEFPAQRASNAENVSIWWRHHVEFKYGNDWGIFGCDVRWQWPYHQQLMGNKGRLFV